MKNNEEGFTLVETVLMLMVTAILLFIPVLSIDKMLETVQVDLFFRELSADITLMQNHSILNGYDTNVRFRPYESGHRIEFIVRNDTSSSLNKIVYLDENLYYFSGKSGTDFSFYKDTGRITQTGSRRFTTVKGRYDLTYWLGSGRFAINKVPDY